MYNFYYKTILLSNFSQVSSLSIGCIIIRCDRTQLFSCIQISSIEHNGLGLNLKTECNCVQKVTLVKQSNKIIRVGKVEATVSICLAYTSLLAYASMIQY